MSVELTVTVQAVIKVEHDYLPDGPDDLDAVKYNALLLGGLKIDVQTWSLPALREKLGECFVFSETDLGYIDANVSFMATDLLDATVVSIDKAEEGK